MSDKVHFDSTTTQDEVFKKIRYLMEPLSSIIQMKPISLEDVDNLDFVKVNHLNNHAILEKFTESIIDHAKEISMDNSTRFYNILKSHLCILYLMFIDPNHAWSSEYCSNNAAKLMDLLCTLKKESVAKILSLNYSTIHKQVISRDSFLKDNTWKRYPAFVQVLISLLRLSEKGCLSQHLGLSAPLILLMIDDYNEKYVVIGVGLLQYLLSNLPAADMRMYGWSDVFYDALFKRLFNSKHMVLDTILPVLLSCLKTIQPKLSRKLKPDELVVIDKTFEQIISNCLITSDSQLLKCYFSNLPAYIEYMGMEVVSHLKQLMNLYSRYLEECHFAWLEDLLYSLNCLIRVAWIRIPHLKLFEELLKTLIRLDQSSSEKLMVDSIYAGVYQCIASLMEINEDDELENAMKQLSSITGFDRHVSNVLKARIS